MASRIAEIRDAVVAVINGGSYSRTVTAVGTYQNESSIGSFSTSTAKVTVQAIIDEEIDTFTIGKTRKSANLLLPLSVTIQGGVDSTDTSDLDEVLTVAEEVEAELFKSSNGTFEYRSGEQAQFYSSLLSPITDADKPETHGFAEFQMLATYKYTVPRL